jgi:hydrogenase 3 maturation protease
MQTPDLLPALTSRLRAELGNRAGSERPVVVLGVGSELRSDDAAGLAVARAVALRRIPGIVGIPAGTAPENSTAELRALNPSHVIIVDAADMGEAPGEVRVIDAGSVGGASFATHGLPLSVLAGYLSSEIGCTVILVGIQAFSVDFGEKISSQVAAGVRMAAQALEDALADPRAGGS